MKRFYYLILNCLVFAFSSTSVTVAQAGEKLLVEIGSLSSSVDTTLSVKGSGGNFGTSISLEDDLGFETGKQINRINFRYRFTEKHSLKYGFFQLNRSSGRVIDRALTVGDTEFQLNANITTDFDYSLHSVSYGYSLLSDEDSDLDLLAGLYYIDIGFSLSEPDLGKFESVNAAGPLPLVGLNYEKELADRWSLGVDTTLFKLDTGDFNGTVFGSRIRVDYQFTERFGLGLAYNWQKFDAGVKDTNATGDFDLTMSGLELAAVLRF